MKNLFLFLFIIPISGCQPDQKNETKQHEPEIYLAHEPDDDDENIKSENVQIANTCSDDYEHPTATLGIGLILVNSGSGQLPSTIELYNDSLLQDKYINWNYYEEEKPQKPVCPKYFMLEPTVVQFVYLKETPKAYQVLNGFDEIKYLAKSKVNVAVIWQNYILNSFGIRRTTTEEHKSAYEKPVRKLPSESSEIITIPNGYEMFCPMEIKGDWVKVQYDCFYNQESNKYEGRPCHEFINKCKPAQFGWLKWREKNKILIDILLMP